MRPTDLTDEVAAKIIAARRRGLAAQKAAARGDVTPKTLYRWLARGEADDAPESDAIYVAFAVAYRRAEADRQEQLLTLSEGDGPNAKDRIKLLELTFPHEFGTRQIVEHVGGEGAALSRETAAALAREVFGSPSALERKPDEQRAESAGAVEGDVLPVSAPVDQ